ncbi:MAG TPA: TolC family protein [Blastocatellia bacterium]|nr:TolC family protein [Blastocatellia bacterium]
MLVAVFVLAVTSLPVPAQDHSGPRPLAGINADIVESIRSQQQAAASGKRSVTLSDAVSIFLQQNLQIVAARYDIETAEAEKLSARLWPNPEFSTTFEGLPTNFTGSFLNDQEIFYGISQTFELGGKRHKRIDAANANAELARAQFETTLWQLTNDLKKRFYTVVLAGSLLNLAKENQKTFDDTLKHSGELYQLGEISGLDLRRIEVEKLKFDTDIANSQRDYEIALRDLRVALGGNYQAMEIEVAGNLDYKPYQFSLADLRDKSLAARPDLKAAQISERAADSAIRLQDVQRIPDLSVVGGIKRTAVDNTYSFGFGISLPVFDRNQTERAKALIQKKQAENSQRLITNQILGDVDKALAAVEIQKKRVELYRTGVLTKVDDIQNLTEFSLKAGESSTLDLLDAIRTRRETLASYYQTLFDYQMSLLDLELATATPLQ